MIYVEKLLFELRRGDRPDEFDDLDPNLEKEEIEKINERFDSIKKIINKEIFQAVIRVQTDLEYLKRFREIMDGPFYLNTISDKYGNQYIQARTTIKDDKGKTKWLNAYVGSVKKYPKGENDPEALALGKILIRKKLIKHYLS
jgi:hypothetical protein